MALVLLDRVIHLVFLAIDVLGPIFAVDPTIYPARIILGFNEKDTIFGHHHMVDLRGMAIGMANQQIINDKVFVSRQPRQNPGNTFLTHFTFGWKKPNQGDQNDNKDDDEDNLKTHGRILYSKKQD